MCWAWRGACGVNSSGITRFSFAGAGSLPCGLLTGFQTSFVHALVSFPLCWTACLGLADGGVGYTLSHAGLLSWSSITTCNHHCSPVVDDIKVVQHLSLFTGT